MKTHTYEESMQKLEQIVSRLESGEATLDESLKLFEEGNQIAKELYTELNNAKGKVTILKQDLDKFREEGMNN